VGQVIADKLAEEGEPGVEAREDRVRWQLAGDESRIWQGSVRIGEHTRHEVRFKQALVG